MNGEKETFNLLEIPPHKKRNPPTLLLPIVQETSNSSSLETKKSNVSAPGLLKSPEQEQTSSISAQVLCPAPDQPGTTVAHNQQQTTNPPPRSRLSGFSLPLFSSTPLNQSIFSQKRRTSSKKGRKQTSATTPGAAAETAPEVCPQSPTDENKVDDGQVAPSLGDKVTEAIPPPDDSTSQSQEKQPLTGKLSGSKSPKQKPQVKMPINPAKGVQLTFQRNLLFE